MADNQKIKTTTPDFQLAFDVGHSSIGWAVLKKLAEPGTAENSIEILGCGAVTFRADDCLASKRRDYRRQRRHIRSTRQRIRRMKSLLAHLEVLTEKELDKPGCAWPWQLAARVLSSKSGDNPATVLSWSELWDVLRWYAHNRGYDGNRRWSAGEVDANEEDTEKVENARSLMQKHGSKSMAETFCAALGIDPLGKTKASRIRFKGLNAAFPREIVESEVRHILRAHFGKLKNVNAELENALLDEWNAIACAAIKLPKRYQGGLLFGQLVPRFDNRIISKCPISGEKVPVRNCSEFLNFRWGMILANIRVGSRADKDLRALSAVERISIDKKIRESGYFTAKELKDAVRSEIKCERDNLDTMLMHPDAKEALLLDPSRKLETSEKLKSFWPLLPERLQKRFRGQLRRGKSISLGRMYSELQKSGASPASFDAEIQRQIDSTNTKSKKKTQATTREDLLAEIFILPKFSGRAPFARSLLAKAFKQVIEAKVHPKEERGCLFISDEIRAKQLNRNIAEQTNNHLVRHRLLILERLLGDIVKEYAGGDKNLIAKITVEVNRDLREMSGKTAKEKAQDLGLRISNHHAVAEKLEKALSGKTINGRPIEISAGLIRKGRIAEDLGWTCPYTGQQFEPIDLVTRRVDKDHIVPRSERASDALDSLVVTYSAVNKWKGKRTAWQFVEQEQGKPVPDVPNLSIVSLSRYKQFVEGLESYRGHDDDKRRKKKRKQLMLLPVYEEKEFTPRDLTQTSQLVRLAAQVLKRQFAKCEQPPVIVSLPGSVTGAVRKAWKVLGCLSLANPQVLDTNGDVKSKTEIRDITHLHHALDACVLGLTSHFIPNNGRIWELIVKRNPNDMEKRELQALGVFGFNAEKRFEMRDLDNRLKEQIRQRLAEKRVVQHTPARMDGLRVEQTTWRVDPEQKFSENDNRILIRQRTRQPDGTLATPKEDRINPEKLLGFRPIGPGKLAKHKGVMVISENFGVALGEEPTVIPFHKVWKRINDLSPLNNGQRPPVLRNGHLVEIPRGNYKGRYRILGIDDKAAGIMIKIGARDVVRRIEKPANYKTALLKTVLRDGLIIVPTSFTGVDTLAARQG